MKAKPRFQGLNGGLEKLHSVVVVVIIMVMIMIMIIILHKYSASDVHKPISPSH